MTTSDPSPDLPALTDRVIAFRDARDWKQFHNPKDVAVSLVLEAAELLEIFQWQADPQAISDRVRDRREQIEDELADVLYYALLLAHDVNVDLSAALTRKLEKNAAKYPVDASKGSSRKYTEL